MGRKRPEQHDENCCSKRSRRDIPALPHDVYSLVLSWLSVRELSSAIQVCKMRNNCVDKNAPRLWEVRCDALGLLTSRQETVLGISAHDVRVRTLLLKEELSSGVHSEDQHSSLTDDLTSAFRSHYLYWARHFCQSCSPFELNLCCRMCTHPKEWFCMQSLGGRIQWVLTG